VKDLLRFIDNSPTAYQAVENSANILLNNGFRELELSSPWCLKESSKYFVRKNNSALVAFITAADKVIEKGFRIIAAHTDTTGLKIKPNPEMIQEKRYLKLNTEVYGSPILDTWFDRPLALAGRLSYPGDNPLKPLYKLININKPLFIIPGLAIHMKSEEKKVDRQKHLLPLCSVIEEGHAEEEFLMNLLSKETGIRADQIIAYDLFLYEYKQAELIGANNEFISAGRLDDLAMVHAALNSLVRAEANDTVLMVVLFDNEEVGSSTGQGADSPFLANILERILMGSGASREEYFCALANSFLISADMAHALHPNFPETADPTNRAYLNGGPVIKISANYRYTSDSYSTAVCKQLCKKADIPYQIFVNHSEQRGGSTIGPILASQLDIRSVDIGNPLLAMHSIRELAGVNDHLYMARLFETLYNLPG
ncbi:MAG: M18 family aminopeptidase, partial [Halanaerobiaceae bacterium]|nr:M18 family aminopeptidase [Halanaerobiaceae bacterium]